MANYRKKPVVIEVRELTDDNAKDICDWMHSRQIVDGSPILGVGINPDGTVVIQTLEGDMLADIGDWVIRGVQGEFYPCKPDIFADTYELVADR